MKRLMKTLFILVLIFCFAIPAFAIKILPYNVPLQDLMRWDKYGETLKISNPEGETMSIPWLSTVDLWNYDGATWTFDLPTGDTFKYSKVVDLYAGMKLVGVAVTSTAAELNILYGATLTVTELNILDGVLATTLEINTIADGILATAAEVNTVCDGVLTGSATVDVANILADAGDSLTITVTDAALGDFAIFSAGVSLAGLIGTCYVSGASTVTVNLENQTASAIDLASTDWKAKVFK